MDHVRQRRRLFILLCAAAGAPFLLLPLLELAPWTAALGLLLVPLVAFPVAATAVQPLKELFALVERLEAGELKARAVLEPGSDWARVADLMTGLADRLDSVTRTLEEQVAARTAALARKADQLRAVGQVSQQVASVLEPEALLHFVVRVMRGTFGYDLAAVLQRHDEHLVLTACAARGVAEPPLGRAFAAAGPAAPPMAAAGQGTGAISTATSPLLHDLAARVEMAVPIRLGERVLGVLVVQSLRPDSFDSEDLFTVQTIAGQVAIALENARLFEAERQLRDLAITEERNRMAREIHDTLAQGFMGIIMQLRAMQTAASEETARFHRETAEALAKESLQEARRSVWNLRPRPLEGKGLAGALADEVASLDRRAALHGMFTATGDTDSLTPAVEAALLRVAQEAIHNAVKYARASRVEVTLAVLPDRVELTVSDDGVGFDPQAQPVRARAPGGGGFGLRAMADRARLLGGELVLDTAPGAGCSVIARIPRKGSI